MTTFRDFRVALCQATIYLPQANTSVSAFLQHVWPLWREPFDGEPVVLPAVQAIATPTPGPGDLGEVPRVLLASADQSWRCEVAPARVNIFRLATRAGEQLDAEGFFRAASTMFLQYHEQLPGNIGRLAALITRYAPTENAARTLAAHFCRDRWIEAPLNRPATFEVHAHKLFDLAPGLAVNSWARSKSGTLTIGVEEVVLFEQDFNTPRDAAEVTDFDNARVEEFFHLTLAGFDQVLQLYFPDEAPRAQEN